MHIRLANKLSHYLGALGHSSKFTAHIISHQTSGILRCLTGVNDRNGQRVALRHQTHQTSGCCEKLTQPLCLVFLRLDDDFLLVRMWLPLFFCSSSCC